MAMLAGPRKKQKVINLRAKNNEWSKDSNKFGQKMLEKMGWTPGKGLGANESGMVEHVIAKYKNDSGGLGFEDKNDQWTQHEDDFNAILEKLSQGEAPQDKLLSGVSLEQQSKSSKARVHYHKFTRGKDLSRYSEKDLANIFGKKTLKKKEKVEDLVMQEDVNIVKSNHIFTTGGNMSDYFNKKSIKLDTLRNNVNEEDVNCAFKGFNGTSHQNKDIDEANDFSFKGFSTSNDQFEEERLKDSQENLEENSIKSKKKKRKSETHQNNSTHDLDSQENREENGIKSKKKKRKSETLQNNSTHDVEQPSRIKYKKKKNNFEAIDVVKENSIEKIKKKKKKSK